MEAVWDRSRWHGISPLSHRVPSLLSVTEEKLRSLAELQQAVLQGTVSDPRHCLLLSLLMFPSVMPRCLNCAVQQAGCQESCCSVVHVVSCEEEFQQQQMDLLWRILDPGAHMDLQVRNSYTLHRGPH